jgi:hypothetical protein
MGTQVTAALDSDTKPNYTVATVAAASVAIVDGEFAIWVGDLAPINMDGYVGLTQCWQALREAGWGNPATTTFNSAKYSTIDGALTVASGAVLPTVLETDVTIIQGFDFTPAGVSNSAHSRRMTESFLESAKAALSWLIHARLISILPIVVPCPVTLLLPVMNSWSCAVARSIVCWVQRQVLMLP